MMKILEQLRENRLFIKYELFFAPIIAVLILIALIILVIFPNILQYLETEKKITETEERVMFFQNKSKTLQSIQKEEYKTGINNSLLILPSDKDAPAAIAQLYYLVNTTGISIQDITFADSGGNSEGKSFRISLELNGSLSTLTNFILKLKETPRIMNITSLEVGSDTGSSDVSASIALNAYYEPLPTSIADINQPLVLPTEKDIEVLNRLNKTSYPVISDDSTYTGPKGKPNPFQ